MTTAVEAPAGPDLSEGVPLSDLIEGEPVQGHFGDEAVMLIRTGEVLAPPALNPLPRYDTEIREGRVRVTGRSEAASIDRLAPRTPGLERVVVLGAGAAGSSAAETLRQEGFVGEIFLVDPD